MNYDLNKTISITIYTDNVDSIEIAEKMKFEAEKKGYAVVNTFGGIHETVLIMAKIEG